MRSLIAAALVACSCAPAAKVPGDAAAAAPDPGTSSPAPTDAGTPAPAPIPSVRKLDPDAPYPGVAPPALLDPDAKTLLAVSPDGRHAIVANDVLRFRTGNPHSGPPCDPSYDIDLRLVTAGSGTAALGVSGRSADFSGDGRFLFATGGSGSFIAHADGRGLRPNPQLSSGGQLSSVGRWLYSFRNRELVRQSDLDDDPSLVLAAADGSGAVTLSPDGESIAYCGSSSGCFLQAPI